MAHCLLLRTLTSWLTALLAPPSLSPLIIATAMRVGHVRRSFPPSQPPMDTIPFHGRTGGILRSLYVKARDAPPEMPPMYMRSASKKAILSKLPFVEVHSLPSPASCSLDSEFLNVVNPRATHPLASQAFRNFWTMCCPLPTELNRMMTGGGVSAFSVDG